MPANKIMLIRHAERPSDDGKVKGVTAHGDQDNEELAVRGWQRSGALVRLFAPRYGNFVDHRFSQPKTIFASAVAPHSPSLRPQHTVRTLAKLLELDPDLRFPKSGEPDLAKAAVKAEGPVLIAWEHQLIPDIVNAIVGNNTTCPQKWRGQRFDLVWILDRATQGAAWSFAQVPQMLLDVDSEELAPFEAK